MSTIKIKDGDGVTKYIQANGTGTELDPFVPIQDVNIQDQTSRLIVAYMSDEKADTLLTNAGAIDDYQITVDVPTNFAEGQYLSIFNVASNRFFLARILTIAGSVFTLDTPLDFPFPAGSFVTGGDTNMAVNGSVTPVIYGLRNTDEAIGTTFDITRIMFTCLTLTAPDLAKFGDIASGLTKGIVLRKVDGTYQNVFNAKTNADLKNIMYDFQIQLAAGAAQDGFTGRLTFAGQNKMGVAIRLAPGEDLQLIVQDDLSTLVNFSIIAEGHEVV